MEQWAEIFARVQRLLARSGVSPARPVVEAAAQAPSIALTRRESEVLQLLAHGRTQDEIAETLVIAAKTVATHIQNILFKMGAHSRAQAVGIAYRGGLVRPLPPER